MKINKKLKSYPKQKLTKLILCILRFAPTTKVSQKVKLTNSRQSQSYSKKQTAFQRLHKGTHSEEIPIYGYRVLILTSISSTANSTDLSNPICSSIVRQACKTVE